MTAMAAARKIPGILMFASSSVRWRAPHGRLDGQTARVLVENLVICLGADRSVGLSAGAVTQRRGRKGEQDRPQRGAYEAMQPERDKPLPAHAFQPRLRSNCNGRATVRSWAERQ